MFLARRPSDRVIERALDESRDLPLSYGPVGIAQAGHGPGRFDERVVSIGRGAADFRRACSALTRWAQFDVGWIELFPRRAGIEPGTSLVLLIRHLGFWSLNGARVVYAVGDVSAGTRFGIAYGTLPSHAESGEELFEVHLDPATAEVLYRIRAVSRPRAFLARLGQPIVRSLQARFRRDSAEAMTRAVRGEAGR